MKHVVDFKGSATKPSITQVADLVHQGWGKTGHLAVTHDSKDNEMLQVSSPAYGNATFKVKLTAKHKIELVTTSRNEGFINDMRWLTKQLASSYSGVVTSLGE